MRSNLIETLLRFADGSRPREEDPITEVLAWLLAQEPALRDCFCDLLANSASERRTRTFWLREPSVRTQVVVQGVAGNISRYDLLLESGRARAVVELKVHSGLTPSGAVDADAPTIREQRHQLHDYLALAEMRAAQGDQQIVFALVVGFVDVGDAVLAHPCWGGSLTWQTVHDAFARRLRVQGETPLDPATKMIAEQLLGVMEVRQMATPRMTLDGAVSVRRAARFRQSITAALEAAWQELHADGTLNGFTKINRSAWQEEDRWTRMGYRLWALSSDANHYGFMGIWYGDETLVEDVPDLYFFLQAKPDGRVGEALRERSAEILDRLTALNTASTQARWHHLPDKWTPISCVSSLAPFVLDADPATAIKNWFRTTLAAARESGLLGIYFEAIKRLA